MEDVNTMITNSLAVRNPSNQRVEVREHMDRDLLTLIKERYPEVLNEKVKS